MNSSSDDKGEHVRNIHHKNMFHHSYMTVCHWCQLNIFLRSDTLFDILFHQYHNFYQAHTFDLKCILFHWIWLIESDIEMSTIQKFWCCLPILSIGQKQDLNSWPANFMHFPSPQSFSVHSKSSHFSSLAPFAHLQSLSYGSPCHKVAISLPF